MILRLKAFIYRHTGIYLADKEEQQFIDKNILNVEKVMLELQTTYQDAEGILRGLWQSHKGFIR